MQEDKEVNAADENADNAIGRIAPLVELQILKLRMEIEQILLQIASKKEEARALHAEICDLKMCINNNLESIHALERRLEQYKK